VILTRSTDWVEQSHSGPQTFASEADGPAEPLDTALFTSRPGLENPAEITLVAVEFLARGDESELVITHERFTKAELAKRYENGWGTIAQKFAAYLAAARGAKRKYAEQLKRGGPGRSIKPVDIG